jgi:phosphoribosylformylglycinamidine cyclo-ligase
MDIGHYAGLIDIGGGRALALHADGVGTKVLVAQLMLRFNTIGIDCVAMTVNDLLCVGAEPVALLDYIALERENDWLVEQLTVGLVEGARQASTAVVGGETAILGDVIKGLAGNGFDLASMGVGVIDRERLIDGKEIIDSDRVVGVRSSGLHSNGYTLARQVLLRRHSLSDKIPALGRTLGEELLVPTRIYAAPVLEVVRKCVVHGLAHVTGGAFSKLRRILKRGNLSVVLDAPPSLPIFDLIQKDGNISGVEMYRTFNMGIGFCIITPKSEVDHVIRACKRRGAEALELGRIAGERGEIRVGGVRVA